LDLSEGITPQDVKLFLAEADEQLQLLDEDIVRLERESDNSNLLQEIFRASHTIKGSSAMLGHQRMSQLAHGMENVLDKVRKGSLDINAYIVDVLLKSLDALKVLKEELVTGEQINIDIDTMLRMLESVIINDDVNPEVDNQSLSNQFSRPANVSDARVEKSLNKGEHNYRIKVIIDKNTTWASARCFQIIQELSKTGIIIGSNPSLSDIEAEKAGTEIDITLASNSDGKTIEDILHSIPDIESVAFLEFDGGDGTSSPAEKPLSSDTITLKKDDGGLKQTIRVDLIRLDTLMEQIGELVINRNYIGQIGRTLLEKYQDDDLIRNLNDGLSQAGKIVNLLQQDIMNIRMLPVDLVFSTMPRMVRDLARKTGKKIDFIVEGKETEVDRSVIEHLHDPIIHLLRNSIDHGIETPEKRRSNGKSETGTVHLSARHEEDHIVISVSDDGKGIDPEEVKAISIKKGVVTADMASRLTENESINLILMSGFSTAKNVTEVSGRGVGLDIVKKNIEFLNGTISIDSKPGLGTKFTLKLPLTLAIVPALMVQVNRTMCAIPLLNIVEVIKLEGKDIKTVMGKEVTLFRANVLPLLRLNSLFKWNTQINRTDAIYHVVVVKACEMQVGFIVDTLIGQQEIVVKSLNQFIGGSNGISGASILGDGQVILILDVTSLIESTISEIKNGNDDKEQIRESTPSISR
jgi:two-component system chemotaxis sensor kinase CheA